jgi:hypothetical protein
VVYEERDVYEEEEAERDLLERLPLADRPRRPRLSLLRVDLSPAGGAAADTAPPAAFLDASPAAASPPPPSGAAAAGGGLTMRRRSCSSPERWAGASASGGGAMPRSPLSPPQPLPPAAAVGAVADATGRGGGRCRYARSLVHWYVQCPHCRHFWHCTPLKSSSARLGRLQPNPPPPPPPPLAPPARPRCDAGGVMRRARISANAVGPSAVA